MRRSKVVELLLAGAALVFSSVLQAEDRFSVNRPILLDTQGSFAVGGEVIQAPGFFPTLVDPFSPPLPDGQTLHGDHAYVQYQIPVQARKYPLVMWHGDGQFSRTWESTPDGREGFKTLFLRRGFSTYVIDQPGRAGASNTTEINTTQVSSNEAPSVGAVPSDQESFNVFRVGDWIGDDPNYFPGVQFPQDPASLEQYFRQRVPSADPDDEERDAAVVSELFDRIGDAILISHSAAGRRGWLTAIGNERVRSIVAYEPTQFVIPEGEVYDTPLFGFNDPVEVPFDDFMSLTTRPIQIVFGDYIPDPVDFDPFDFVNNSQAEFFWGLVLLMSLEFADRVNELGGNAQVVVLPDIGVTGNTHFPFSDLNNRRIAALLFQFLRDNELHVRDR
ncbi:MAG: alpha/beta fold hydrolase [Pseudomonadota bacterium]